MWVKPGGQPNPTQPFADFPSVECNSEIFIHKLCKRSWWTGLKQINAPLIFSWKHTDAKGSGLTVTLALREQLQRNQIVKLKVFHGDSITSKGVCHPTVMMKGACTAFQVRQTLQKYTWNPHWFSAGLGTVGLTVGINDPKDLLQPKWLCDSVVSPR